MFRHLAKLLALKSFPQRRALVLSTVLQSIQAILQERLLSGISLSSSFSPKNDTLHDVLRKPFRENSNICLEAFWEPRTRPSGAENMSGEHHLNTNLGPFFIRISICPESFSYSVLYCIDACLLVFRRLDCSALFRFRLGCSGLRFLNIFINA